MSTNMSGSFNKVAGSKLRVFISQPMNDKTDEEIEAERTKAIQRIKSIHSDCEIEVIDSFFKDAPHEARPLWFLGKSLELLSTADLAYFCKGWQNYRGCKIENLCCEKYNISFLCE